MMNTMKNIQKTYWLAVILLMLVVLALPTGPSQAQTAAGFRISGRNLLDANGNNFIMRGVSHAHTWYPSQTSSFANIKATGANTVRVVLSGGRWTKNTASDVANVINLCKTNKLICVLENHDTTGYGEDGAAVSLSQAVAYWKEIQSVLTGQEAYIIINIGNEPYGNNNASAWVNATKNAIAELRSAGFEHTIMVDAPNWGQDWSFVMRDNAASIFNSDPDKNLIFSIHMYGVFDTASEVQSYVSTFVSAGLPLVIGEFGHNHSDGNPDEDAIMAQAQANGIGYIGLSWSGNGGGVEYLDMVTNFNPAQLTPWGERIVNGANGIGLTSVEASVYGGGGPTNTPGGPTATRTITPIIPTATRTNTPGSGALKVQLVTGGTDNNQQTAFHFRVQNTGTSAVSNVSVRLYFSLDGSQAASKYILEKYYDQSGVATISGPTQVSGSNYYFTINYGTKSLPAGTAWEYHTALRLSDWSSNYVGSNDWWHTTGALPASYTDWTNIPAYLSGSLRWGSEPGSGPTHTPTATGTMTRTPTATPSISRTPTPTTCPMATAEPLWVEPVTSPSDQTTQVITVRTNNSDSVTVALESGSFTVTGNFSSSNLALVTVSLLPNTEHHLTVSAHIKTVAGPGGCTYGGYTLSTRNDRYGMPLTIVQSDGTGPTFTPTPTNTPTHTPTPTQLPGATCAVTYSMNDWGSGFTANVTIANNGSTTINGWMLAWAFPGSQTITNLWNGSYTQSGQSVSVTNLGYNSNIPANGNVNFGFNANYSAVNVRPTVFSLNGSLCSVNP